MDGDHDLATGPFVRVGTGRTGAGGVTDMLAVAPDGSLVLSS